MEVDIIVSKRRPDPEAQRIWGIRGDTLEIEGPRGNTLMDARTHSMHSRFRNQIRTARNYARDHESNLWMLVRYATVSFQIAAKGGEHDRFGRQW